MLLDQLLLGRRHNRAQPAANEGAQPARLLGAREEGLTEAARRGDGGARGGHVAPRRLPLELPAGAVGTEAQATVVAGAQAVTGPAPPAAVLCPWRGRGRGRRRRAGHRRRRRGRRGRRRWHVAHAFDVLGLKGARRARGRGAAVAVRVAPEVRVGVGVK
eukprot:scaffold34276_cov35-Phaeocystis_antarctica.AAC.3